MVGKKFISRVMEEFLGEYILNISEENLKLGIVRGKLKLDNVQLDGDLIGSHILGAVGLSGFGILSCTAWRLSATIPWNKLEKEPTRFELSTLNIICVPLLPSNADRMFGAGTANDPKCTLKTRAKRSVLARFERNFFSWRIPGEGPPRPNQTNRGSSGDDVNKMGDGESLSQRSTNSGVSNDSHVGPDNDRNGNVSCNGQTEEKENRNENISDTQQNTWTRRFVSKLFRNIEVTIRDIHIRCEASEGSLNLKQSNSEECNDSNTTSDQSSFAFGFTIDSIVYKSANSDWQTGNINWNTEKKSLPKGGHSDETPQIRSDEKRYKVLQVEKISMYWDDHPPVLISECHILNYADQKLSSTKFLTKIRLALGAMATYQNPGEEILSMLEGRDSKRPSITLSGPCKGHDYCLSPSSLELRLTFSNMDEPGPTQCFAELLQCHFDLKLRPHQVQQYRTLRNMMIAQQRLDTMLHQRPHLTPLEDPRAWWRYIISCVMTRPNIRPWRDVLQITSRRSQYIELVMKKILNGKKGAGFHGGLNEQESLELIQLEDLLPIEALLSFHLVALRNTLDLRKSTPRTKTPKLRRSLSRRKFTDTSLKSTSISRRNLLANNQRTPTKQRKYGDDIFEDTISTNNSIMSTSSFELESYTPERKIRFVQIPRSPLKTQGPRSPLSSPLAMACMTKVTGGQSIRNTNTPISFFGTELRTYENVEKSTKSPMKVIMGSRKFRSLLQKSKYGDENFSDSLSLLSFDEESRKLDRFLEKQKVGVQIDNTHMHESEVNENPPMHRTFQVQTISLTVVLLDKLSDSRIIQADIRASGCAENSVNGTTLLFDLKNVEVKNCMHNMTELLTFHDTLNTRDVNIPPCCFSSNDLGTENNHEHDSSVSLEELKKGQKKAFSEYMLLQTNTDVPLPPLGVVCRVLASASSSGISFTISACAATFIWNSSCLKTIADSFFPGHPSEKRVLHRQLRNAATPLAHKTQLALTSPNFLSIRMNIDAPKLWIPISHKVSDGALFVDAGRLKMSVSKPEKVTTLRWIADSTKIQVNFVRGLSRLSPNDIIDSVSHNNSREDISVILPFDIHLTFDKIGEGPREVTKENVEISSKTSQTVKRKSSKLKIRFSKISLNLVDVEVLAKAIGKWYAMQLLGVKRRGSGVKVKERQPSLQPSNNHPICFFISVSIKKIEMMLEGQQTFLSSKKSNQVGSSIGKKFPKRTYKIQIVGICISREVNDSIRNSLLEVDDVRIVQMARKYKSKLKRFTNTNEYTQHPILAFAHANRRKKLAISRNTRKDGVGISSVGGSCPQHSVDNNTLAPENYVPAITATLLQDEGNHLNDIDIDLNYLCIHITPNSLSDFSRSLSRIFELTEIMTGEMERRVHESGRTARFVGRKSVNTISLNKDISCRKDLTDSSLLVKVNLKDVSLLATWSIATVGPSSASYAQIQQEENIDDVVVQIFSSVLVMLQSIENRDLTGTKTTHVSIDNLSSSIGEELESIPVSEVPPIIGPIAAEFRLVSSTVDSGTVVSQESSLDCDSLKASVTPRDLRVLICVCGNIVGKLKSVLARRSNENNKTNGISNNLFHYRKKGTAVAATTRFEVQPFSIVLLHSVNKNGSRKPLFDLRGRIRGKLQGCVSAMAGDIRCELEMNFFNPSMSDWESVFEKSFFLIEVEQLPNEVTFGISTSHAISSNLTSSLLTTLAEINFDVFDKMHRLQSIDEQPKHLPCSNSRSTKEYKDIKKSMPLLVNESGLDLLICPMDMLPVSDQGIPKLHKNNPASMLVENDCLVTLGGQFRERDNSNSNLLFSTVAIAIAPTSERLIGKRDAIFHLPLHFDGDVHNSNHRLECFENFSNMEHKHKHTMEPVVEWCMQNQRLKTANLDASTGIKSLDHLSSTIWSPGDDYHEAEDEKRWVQPYLDGDPAEWTDMTCLFPVTRDCIMLPNRNWVWASDWTVDVSGDYCVTIDADGWEYAESFDAFGRTRRFYKINDTCRRRKWTRTRLIIPPELYDPLCQLSLVWKCSIDDSGNQVVKIRSKLKIHNMTASNLSFFVSSVSWGDEVYAGAAVSGGYCIVPTHLSSATYLRLAKRKNGYSCADKPAMYDYFCSERNLILPTSHMSCSTLRTSINLPKNKQIYKELDQSPTYHFLVQTKHTSGMTEIRIEPVLKIVNNLPCQLQYRLYEKLGALQMREENFVSAGQETSSLAVNPCLKPFVSFRVPGYRWSTSQRIVNRQMSSTTWTPSNNEKDIRYKATDKDTVHGYEALIHFESIIDGGDPLTIVLLVQPGHSPSLRVYAQYWIRDKSGFGLKLLDGSSDFTGTTLNPESNRHSYLSQDVINSSAMKRDMQIAGHQWPIGMNGMSLYFSREEKIAIIVEKENEGRNINGKKVNSNWTQPLLDVSNVMPKTVFSVGEENGQRRFELCFNVTVAPSIFSRTKIINIFPRYRIVNLMDLSLNIAQSGCWGKNTYLPHHCATPFHLEDGTQSSQIHLATCSNSDMNCTWTVGTINLDKIGITSIRLPENVQNSTIVQAEVRLATKLQDSAVVILLWKSNDQTSPLYLLRNMSSFKIFCSQLLCDNTNSDIPSIEHIFTTHPKCTTSNFERSTSSSKIYEENSNDPWGNKVSEFVTSGLECGLVDSVPDETLENYTWSLSSGEVTCFGFDDPNKQHVLEWTCDEANRYVARVDIDAIGSSSVLSIPGGQKVLCQVRAENSSKVVEFVDVYSVDQGNLSIIGSIKEKISHFEVAAENEDIYVPETEALFDEIEFVVMKICFDIPTLSLSVIDNETNASAGREILYLHCESLMVQLSQNRDGYHELELRVMSLQVDNHVRNAIHPILVFCPEVKVDEPFLHLSAVRRLQQHCSTFVFRYVAVRVLEVDIALDRRTVEALLKYTEPLRKDRQMKSEDARIWISTLTNEMASTNKCTGSKETISAKIDTTAYLANSGRVYFEQLHLHPLRITLTFTQGWYASSSATEMALGYISSVPSLAKAPLTFTSFVVSDVFEAPDNLLRIIGMHYFSQVTTHFFSIIGSLAIFNGPADFLANVGTGVRDFFYEPINGLVHGPTQFIEGLETGSLSLFRGVFVGVVKGAANVTLTVNSNLIGLTDECFIDERNANQRALTDALSHGAQRTIADSVSLAGASVVHGIRSGAVGMIEKPLQSFAKHGAGGFLQGVGKALVGAIIKPVVGVGDGAVLVMNHLSEATNHESMLPQRSKRLRRGLSRKIQRKPHSVSLLPYDDDAATAQKIVTVDETTDDIYIGHVYIKKHLMIASEQSLWVIEHEDQDPWRIDWKFISHYGIAEGGSMRIAVFSETGLKSHSFEMNSAANFAAFNDLLKIQVVNGSSRSTVDLHNSNLSTDIGNTHKFTLPGLKSRQEKHIFGSINNNETNAGSNTDKWTDIVKQCYDRVKKMGSESPSFFSSLDEEAWALIDCFALFFSALNSRRCVIAGLINASGVDIQIKSASLVEGGSPVFRIPSREYDEVQAVLHPGAAIIFFAWGVAPSLHHEGGVFMKIETNAFCCNLFDKIQCTSLIPVSGYQTGFLEKSYDKLGWWAKYWLLITR